MANKDYYNTLGVSKDATEKEIKDAFRKLSLKYHPDRQGGKSDAEKKAAEERFKEVAEAYSVLSDKDKKQQYDTYGTVGDQGFSSMNMDDIFEHFRRHEGFSSFFGDSFFGNSGRTQNIRKKGKAIKLNVHVTIQEIYNNVKKIITYDRYEPCSHCGGKGVSKNGRVEMCSNCHGTGMYTKVHRSGFSVIQQSSQCPVCGGTGQIIINPCTFCNGTGLERKRVTRTVQIPVGCVNNSYVTIAQGGNYCEKNDGDIGDLVIIFKIDDDKNFEIADNGCDIIALKEVSVIDCILGTEQYINGIDGKTYKFKIDVGTTDGNIYSLKGRGMPRGNGTYGNMNIYIRQNMPSKLTKEDIELLNKLKKSKTFS